MKNCFLITAYCDNNEKVSVISECIDNIKTLTSDDIFIHSHYAVDTNIQNKVKTVIFDKSNPILKYPTKGYNFWRTYKEYTMSVVTDDYGYAVLSQWKNSMNYLTYLGYDNIFIINYDAFINKDMYDKSCEYSRKYDGVIYHWSDGMINGSFNVINSRTIDIFHSITLEHYLKNSNDLFEMYVEKIINNSNFSFKKVKHDEYKDNFYSSMDINSVERHIDNDLPDNNLTEPYVFFNHPYPESIEEHSKLIFQYHISSKLIGNKDTNILNFLFFNVKKEITLKIIIDDITLYDNVISDDLYLESNYKYEDFRIGTINVNIFVDDVKIDSKLIDKLKQNCRIKIK